MMLVFHLTQAISLCAHYDLLYPELFTRPGMNTQA